MFNLNCTGKCVDVIKDPNTYNSAYFEIQFLKVFTQGYVCSLSLAFQFDYDGFFFVFIVDRLRRGVPNPRHPSSRVRAQDQGMAGKVMELQRLRTGIMLLVLLHYRLALASSACLSRCYERVKNH